MKGHVKGLCGNYNSDERDDKEDRAGLQVISSKLFTAAWEVAGHQPCTPVTAPNVIQKKAFQLCNIIRFPPFNLCQNIVPKNIFVSKCTDLTEECLNNGNNDEGHCK